MTIATGRLQMRDWEDKNGNKRRNAEVIADSVYFGESKRNTGTNAEPPEFEELEAERKNNPALDRLRQHNEQGGNDRIRNNAACLPH